MTDVFGFCSLADVRLESECMFGLSKRRNDLKQMDDQPLFLLPSIIWEQNHGFHALPACLK
jgi:hypothetical protein